MKLIQPQVTEYIQKPGVDGIYEAVRDAAAVCYQTDVDKMKLPPREFVENVLIKNGHTRPLEFGTVYLKCARKYKIISFTGTKECESPLDKYMNNHWSSVVMDDDCIYVTTNLRVIMQGGYLTGKIAHEHNYDKNWLTDIEQYGVDYIEGKHAKRTTLKLIVSRGAMDDFRTHIGLSAMAESTRYCNYSKNKFGCELMFVDPVWWKDNIKVYNCLQNEFCAEEWIYRRAAQIMPEAQMLKRLIPLSVKAELRLCGFDTAWNSSKDGKTWSCDDAWMNLLWRRTGPHADPECKWIADRIKNILRHGDSDNAA